MSTPERTDDKTREKLKVGLKKLHAGEDVESVRAELKEVLRETSATDIAIAEQGLVEDGMKREELTSLCDIHMELFRETLEESAPDLPENHPLRILIDEHSLILCKVTELAEAATRLGKKESFATKNEIAKQILESINILKNSEDHYLREENALFPMIEKHGVTEPPAVMWSEHDRIRGLEKSIFKMVDEKGYINPKELDKFRSYAIGLSELIAGHFQKENRILFKMALQLITDEEWKQIKADFDEIGYTIVDVQKDEEEEPTSDIEMSEGIIQFETGQFTPNILEAMLDTLPIDITFVNAEDQVQYFSNSPERFFVRTKSVIGRDVHNCHPKKSIEKVKRILEGFKKGALDKAEFWINLGGKLIFIRYFPVHDREGKYLGCLEVSQDITNIRNIEGEKRLLDF